MTRYRLAKLPRWLRDFIPLVCWLGLIFWLSSHSVLIKIQDQAGEKLFYKSAHMLAYAVLAWLWWRALTRARVTTWTVLAWAFTLTTLYGISDEIHQLFVPGRHGQVADVLFDASGALLMILLIRRIEFLHLFPENIPILRPKREGKSSGVVSYQ